MVEEMRSIQADLPYNAMLAVPCLGRRGGLAMLWKEEEVNLHIQTYTQNHIDALVLTDPTKPWRIIGFYGRPKEHLRGTGLEVCLEVCFLLTPHFATCI